MSGPAKTPKLSPGVDGIIARLDFRAARLADPAAMTSPPTVSAASTSTGISPAPTLFPMSNINFRYLGAPVVQVGGSYPDNLFVRAVHPTDPGGTSRSPLIVEFDLDTDKYELLLKGNGGKFRVFEYEGGEMRLVAAGYTTLTNNGSVYRVLHDRGARARRRVRVEGHGLFFGGVYMPITSTITQPAIPRGPKVICMGDSFGEGTGANSMTESLLHKGLLLAGIRDIDVAASGGTGYVNPGTGGRVKFGDRVATDIVARQPNADVVVIQGGINDSNQDVAAVGVNAAALFAAVKAGLPKAKVIALGPFQGVTGQTAGLLAARDAIKTAALAAGVSFIDPLAEYWLYGAGKVGATSGAGNTDFYISNDGTHPSPDGHLNHGVQLASHFLDAIGA